MNFVWDQRKNRANLARHGIAFEDAIRIFEGPTLEKVDDRFEWRISSLHGRISRIISAWRAERHERKAYWQNLS